MFLDEKNKNLIFAGYSQHQHKTLIFSHKDIIENFLHQEKTSEPHFSWYNYKTGKPETPPGFLIWSLFDGCGVAYRNKSGSIILIKGVQADFCYN